MKILSVDIGTGTQDIFLYDSRLGVENGYKMVMPSPTLIVHRKIKAATQSKRKVCLVGRLMGGGPNQWAAEEHIRQGFKVYATPEAALTYNDDLTKVREMGVKIISEDEAVSLPDEVEKIHLRDFDFDHIYQAFESFHVDLADLNAICVAVFDHGNAPANVSDRKFRFDFLKQILERKNSLSAFAYPGGKIPAYLTRMKAIERDLEKTGIVYMLMDTAPAAVMGAALDPVIRRRNIPIIGNIGNMHTLMFQFEAGRIAGLFEHHTGELNALNLDDLIAAMAGGTLTNEDIFNHHGHGALLLENYHKPHAGSDILDVAITGPRRSLLNQSKHRIYFPSPFGDMMMSGCYGMIAALGDHTPEWKEEIITSMVGNRNAAAAPWDI